MQSGIDCLLVTPIDFLKGKKEIKNVNLKSRIRIRNILRPKAEWGAEGVKLLLLLKGF